MKMKLARIKLFAVAALAAIATMSRGALGADPSYELARTDTTFMLVETGVSLGLLVSANLADVPESCRWCASNSFDRAGHDALLAGDQKTAATASHVLSFGVVPLTAIGALSITPLLRDQSSDALPNTAILLNVVMVDVALTSAAKLGVARRRPGFYYGQQAGTEYADSKTEENLSFFSGDTSVAFSLAAAGSTLAFLRGYEYAPYIAVGSGLAATGAGILRISANAHWPTDVITGALVGSAVGIGVPLLLHPRLDHGDDSPVVSASAPIAGGPPQIHLTMAW